MVIFCVAVLEPLGRIESNIISATVISSSRELPYGDVAMKVIS